MTSETHGLKHVLFPLAPNCNDGLVVLQWLILCVSLTGPGGAQIFG